MNNKNELNSAYFYVKSPDLAFITKKYEDEFSDSHNKNCEYCENTSAYDY